MSIPSLYSTCSVCSKLTASLSAVRSFSKPLFSFVTGQELTTWDSVWISPHKHSSVWDIRHLFWQTQQQLWDVYKWFSKDHCHHGNSTQWYRTEILYYQHMRVCHDNDNDNNTTWSSQLPYSWTNSSEFLATSFTDHWTVQKQTKNGTVLSVILLLQSWQPMLQELWNHNMHLNWTKRQK